MNKSVWKIFAGILFVIIGVLSLIFHMDIISRIRSMFPFY